MKKTIALVIGIIFAGFLLIQLVPYGRAHENPPVMKEPTWANAQTLDLARRACFDCHSNKVVWPWYSNVAPVSWLVQHDVEEGRNVLNFSEWGLSGEYDEIDEMAEVINENEMPPAQYLLTHPEARLSAAEKQILADGLMITAGASSQSFGEENRGEEKGESYQAEIEGSEANDD